MDMSFQGPINIWTNTQSGPATISERIDRVFMDMDMDMDMDWMKAYSDATLTYVAFTMSDHKPLLLTLEGT